MARAERVSSYAAAARTLGVTAATIRLWVQKGWLPQGPWTHHQLSKAATKSRQALGPGSTAEHGTTSRWRAGCDCDACRTAHNTDITARRNAARAATLAPILDELLERLAAGDDYGRALADLGTNGNLIGGHRRWDPDFARQLDDALMTGRDPNLRHGTASGWRARCRCPECREHHEHTR